MPPRKSSAIEGRNSTIDIPSLIDTGRESRVFHDQTIPQQKYCALQCYGELVLKNTRRDNAQRTSL